MEKGRKEQGGHLGKKEAQRILIHAFPISPSLPLFLHTHTALDNMPHTVPYNIPSHSQKRMDFELL